MDNMTGVMGQFFWFMGVVEDTADPLQIGRVKVRHITEHNPSSSEYVETDDLPWAVPMTPIGSASRYGIGDAPVGLKPGSLVIGFYMDGKKKTKPMIIGSWPVYNESETDHSVSRYARGISPVEKEYEDYEPRTQYAAEYPFNKVTTTPRGHVIEIDDTPEGERIHIFHREGSYIEMNPDGSVVTKSMDKTVHISMKDEDIVVDDGDLSLIVNEGNINITSEKNINIISDKGTITVKAPSIRISPGR